MGRNTKISIKISIKIEKVIELKLAGYNLNNIIAHHTGHKEHTCKIK